MTRKPVILLVLALAAAASAEPIPPQLARLTCSQCLSADDARGKFSPEQWLNLEDGEAVIEDRPVAGAAADQQREAEAFGIISWPPQLVWDVLIDFESRPKYMANSTKSKITSIDGNQVHVDQELEILWETIRFSVVNVADPERGTIRWTMDRTRPHDIDDTTGTWQIAPLDAGRHCLLMYSSHTVTGRSVPSVIESYLIKRSLPKMISAVRDETRRRGKNSVYVLPGTSSDRKKR